MVKMKTKKQIDKEINLYLTTTGIIDLQNKKTELIKLNGENIGIYLKKLLLKTKIISQKSKQFYYHNDAKCFGCNSTEIRKGKQFSINAEFKNFLILYYFQGETVTRFEDSKLLGTDSISSFQIFKKGKKINLADKLFKYEKYPSVKDDPPTYVSFENKYLRGSKNEIDYQIFSLEFENSKSEIFKDLDSNLISICRQNKEIIQGDYEKFMETQQDVRNAEQQITNYLNLVKKEYADLEKIIQ